MKKEKTAAKRKVGSEIISDTREFFKTLPSVFGKFRFSTLLLILAVVSTAVMLLPYDHLWNREMIESRTQPWLELAMVLRKWGAFWDTVTVTALVFLTGWLSCRRNWRRLAVVLFLTSSLAGIAVNVPRILTGRPRPSVGVEDRWYGPVFLYPKSWIPGDRKKPSAFQSFPSGHTAATVASATMLLVAAPGLGIPVVISSGGVVWSCLYANKHYATDVAVGAGFGLVFGLAGGFAFRRMRAKSTQSMR